MSLPPRFLNSQLSQPSRLSQEGSKLQLPVQTPFTETFLFLPVSLSYINSPLGNFLAMHWKEARVRPDIWHASLLERTS